MSRVRLSVLSLEERSTPTTLPAGFGESLVTAGLTRPTAQTPLPDGRLLVTEQGGTLRVVQNGSLVPAPALSLTVDSAGERGLLGVVTDPNFGTNGFVYLYHTVPASVGGPFNRISRVTLVGNTADPAGRVTLVDLDPLSGATNHNGGALHVGADGKLYAAVGENANPPLAQSLTTRHGKILRYNLDGTIPADNPTSFAGVGGSTSGANRAIYAVGFRNPFTFAVQPGTGRVFVNDVGQNSFEEVDDLLAGRNYGWPATEGDFTQSQFPDFTRPLVSYAHGAGTDKGFAVGGAAFYNPATASFPADYAGDYFFGDIVNGWIRRFDPASGQNTLFASDLTRGQSVDLDVTPAGELLYLARGNGSVGDGAIYRISFTQQPSVVTPPASVTVQPGQPATFSVTASGTAPLTYQWQRNGADIPGATGPMFTLANPQLADSGARFRVVVSNAASSATSAEATLTVSTNRLPVPTIVAPAAGSTFVAGQAVSFSGGATDPEDGPLAASALTWRVDYVTGGLVRPFVPDTPGVPNGSFVPAIVTPYTLPDVSYRITLTARDSAGATVSVSRDVLPITPTVTIRSNPAGTPLALDGQPTGDTFLGVAGVRRQLTAPATAAVNGGTWRFVGWSDGVPTADRPFSTPTAATTVEAVYRPAPSIAVGPGSGSAVVQLLDPLTNTVTGRFDLSSRFGPGIRMATADVTGDGVPELIAGAGPGGPPLVAVLDGRTGETIASGNVFEASFTGGVNVAAADLNADGRAEVIVAPDEGGGPRVRALNGTDFTRVLADFFGIDDPAFRGGARVAAADLTGDGRPELIVAAGFGGGPRIAGYDGAALAGGRVQRAFDDFFAFEPTLRNGTFVAAGDFDADGKADLAIGAGPGGGPRVLALSGAGLLANQRTPLADFFAGDVNSRGGVRVAARDGQLVAGTAPGTPARVTVYSGAGLPLVQTLTPFGDGFGDGVFVG